MTRYFLRLPAFADIESAVDACEAHGFIPRLHDCQSAPVVGCVEIPDPNNTEPGELA